MAAKGKPVNFKLIPEGDAGQMRPYELLQQVRQAYHEETIAARVALAWRVRQRSDKDGHLVLGKCVKVSDLWKEFAAYDFVIVLNREVWEDKTFGEARQKALLDHEMCHAAAVVNEDGDPQYDERNRRLWRIRKHDIEEFTSVVQHHGVYKRDLEVFAKALLKKKAQPLFATQDETRAEATVQ
jgi:Putative phage metallopeptidase